MKTQKTQNKYTKIHQNTLKPVFIKKMDIDRQHCNKLRSEIQIQ